MKTATIHSANKQYTSFGDVKARFFKNKPAVIGAGVIGFLVLIAFLGYLIMPDDTPNANDSAPQIAKLTPGSDALILKIRKNFEVEQRGFWGRYVHGQESLYSIEPIAERPEIIGDTLYYLPYGAKERAEEGGGRRKIAIPLVSCVKAVYVGPVEGIALSSEANYYVRGDSVYYIGLDKKIAVTTRAQLEKDFWENNIEERFFLLGTDRFGRDMLSRLIYGARTSLTIGFIAVIIAILFGVLMGSIAGYFGGWLDKIIVWFMTVIWSVPTIMLVICISIALNDRGIWVTFVAVGFTMWVEAARQVRGAIKSIKERQFIEAARAFGFSDARIIFYHILPNLVGPLIVIATSNFAEAILIEAGLSFLGLGVRLPTPSWGQMINDGFQAFTTRNSWHLIVLPSLCISITVLAFNVVGNGLRDAVDPKTKLNK